MSDGSLTNKATKVAVAIVVGLGASLGSAVAVAPPAHAMLPQEPRSLTSAEIARIRLLQEQKKMNQLQDVLAAMSKATGMTIAAILRAVR